jgi:hypothetical protein
MELRFLYQNESQKDMDDGMHFIIDNDAAFDILNTLVIIFLEMCRHENCFYNLKMIWGRYDFERKQQAFRCSLQCKSG